MRSPNHYPTSKPLWALALSASLTLANLGININGSGADKLSAHADSRTSPCVPTLDSSDFGRESGPSVNALENIIARIRRGQEVEVTSKLVSLTDKDEVKGRGYPIVFKLEGSDCIAFADGDPVVNYNRTLYDELQAFYTVTTEPAAYQNIPLVEATTKGNSAGLLSTKNGLIVGWSEEKVTNHGCNFRSCPDPA